MQQSTGAVLITAAASGIGAACTKMLVQQGWWVLAGVRNTTQGETLRQQTGGQITPLLLDVTDAELIQAAAEHVRALLDQTQSALIGVVNTATREHHGPLELLPLAFVRQELEVDCLGTLAVIQAFLPLLRRSRGRIVNFSSVTGRCVFRGIGASCAAKYAVEAISDALRLELAPWGIHVAVIEPGAVATPLWDKTQQAFEDLPNHVPQEKLRLYYPSWPEAVQRAKADQEMYVRMAMPPERIAHAVCHVLTSRKPKTRYLVADWQTRGLIWLKQWLPDRWFDRLAMGQFRDQTVVVTD